MKVISFDIGLKTCSVAIEEYKLNDDDVKTLKTQLPVCKYLKTGEATPEMKTFVQNVSRFGRVLHLEKKELGDKKAFYAGIAFTNLYVWCEQLSEHLTSADIILIEQQMNCNKMAIALMYHLQAWLMIHGVLDTYIKPEMARTLFKMCNSPKKLWVVPGARHNMAIQVAPEEYKNRVLSFFDSYLASSSSVKLPSKQIEAVVSNSK
jgi:hypothetical protein